MNIVIPDLDLPGVLVERLASEDEPVEVGQIVGRIAVESVPA